MSYRKKDDQDFALKLLLMEALAVRGGRRTHRQLKSIIKVLEVSHKPSKS